MTHLSLYHEHYGVRYTPRGLASWLFYVLCLLAILVVPFVIALFMQNFWVRVNYFYDKPEVTFTGRCAVRVSTVLGKEYLWTCSDLFHGALQGTSLRILPYFSTYEDDRDGDGKIDYANFLMSFPLGDALEVSSLYEPTSTATDGGADAPTSQRDAILEASFLPEFVYYINHQLVKVNMTAAPLLRYRRAPMQKNFGTVTTATTSTYSWSGAPVCALTKADMLFYTTQSLINSPYVSYMHTYTSSPLQELARQPADLLDLPLFSGNYAARNQSVVLRPYVEAAGGLDVLRRDVSIVRGLWEDLDDLNTFTWYVQLRIPPAEVQYVPSYAEVLKWGWIQYFAIAYVVQWILWKLRMALVKMGLINSRALFSTMRRQY
ncbi:conserved hypothetical protein [Leishmania mexicana MHOM/GT/2001/U1103]|uniref:Transmembrane protein 231 n=1 Tax=Leishmania mexicana (strain MHOM/GT/2001/U1103) TaxID=929439 RepID=E9AUJ0_LEIMU|nr:conserved hypothetical protein [Leishmania mexicana MHOM/GT/2001/U1103]CBZ26619.1 conserved hypothetical protein [Leishmania mexicana MHOM/GT/2001/U1103]